MNSVRVSRHRGFTLIEIMVVIAVIGILAVIGTIAYQGFQQRAQATAALNDLNNAVTVFEQYAVKNKGAFPERDYLVANLSTSNEDTLLTAYTYNAPAVYIGLGSVQNGVLFHQICQQLVDDGLGTGDDDGGNPQHYISNCSGDTGGDRIQIDGWDSKKWYTPVTEAQLLGWVDSLSPRNYHASYKPTIANFYQTLVNTYKTQGGTFPITSFWNHDANPWWGVYYEALPSPTIPSTDENTYCIQANSSRFPEVSYVITSSNTQPREGTCS